MARAVPHHAALAISRNLVRFLRDAVRPGEEASVAINNELRAVIVFIDGKPVLQCSFEELISWEHLSN